MAKKNAGQKPATSNFDPMILSESIIIKTVMINETRPKVNQFNGNVNKRRIPPTIAFTNPITKPVRIAHPKPATVTPGIIHDAIATTKPVTKRLIMNLIT